MKFVLLKLTAEEYDAVASKAKAQSVGEFGLPVPVGRLLRLAALRALGIPTERAHRPRRRRRVAG